MANYILRKINVRPVSMIHADALVKEFNGFRALDNVSFDLEKTGILGVVGHNGAGKTTLLKIMAGLLAPTSGRLEINGIDVAADPVGLKRELGYLSEESNLYEMMTVGSYLSFFGEIYGLDQAVIRKRGDALLSSLDLDARERITGELSKGMRRKVAIARSLIHDPSILIYDEPASGLDAMTSRYIGKYLRDLRTDSDKMIILSAHNLHQVEEICDRVIILRRGSVLASGTMQELREVFGTLIYEVYYVSGDSSSVQAETVNDMDSLNRLTASIAEAGGIVRRIESRHPSLEDMLVRIGR